MKKTKKVEIITKEFVRVFVYGTLKQTYNPRSMKEMGAEYVGPAIIKDATVFVGRSGIPFVKDAPGKTVNGEVWNLPAEKAKSLDGYEYAYTPRLVETADGVLVKVYWAPEGKWPYSSEEDAVDIGSDYNLDNRWAARKETV